MDVPKGKEWYKVLLQQMAESRSSRPAMISEKKNSCSSKHRFKVPPPS